MRNRNGIISGLLITLLLAVLTATTYAAAPAKPITLTIQVDTRPNYTAWLEKQIAEFEALYPHIEVNIWIPPQRTYQTLLVSYAGGTAPDIALQDPFGVLDFARMGMLEDLTPFVQANWNQYKDWFPPALEMTSFQGKIYGLPRELQSYGIYYNVDLFNEVGIRLPDERWTWNDYSESSRRIARVDAQGNQVRWGSKLPVWRDWVLPLWAHGGDLVDDWGEPKAFTGRTDETIKGFEFWNEMLQNGGLISKANHGANPLTTVFKQQRTGMIMSTTIHLQALADAEGFTWDVGRVPVGPAGRVTAINGLSWFMFNTSAHKAEAFELLRHITSTQALRDLVQIDAIPPHRALVVQDWLRYSKGPANRHLLLEGMETARPDIGKLTELAWTPINKDGLRIIWGEVSPLAGLDSMQREVETVLKSLY